PIADRLGCTIAQLALAWCIKNPQVSSVITGASQPEQLEDNLRCLSIVPKLTDEILQEIEAVLQNKPDKGFNFRHS
ncbi:NADP-dependent oxidoreductase domain-containing protein, partial [Jimgerdemannia flammicorona]